MSGKQAQSECIANDGSCEELQSKHNEFIKEEFARQSQQFYNASKTHKADNLTPLIEAANIGANDIILDLGCGPGMITTECAKKHPQKVYAMDITKEMLDIAKKHAIEHQVADRIEFIRGNVENLPFEDNTFDIVITRWTFHHFDKLNKIMQEIYRVLKPQTGKLVFLEFCAPNNTQLVNVFNAMHTIRDPSHVWAHSEYGWIQQVNKGGFDMNNIEIVQRITIDMNWLQFIQWTNPSEDDERARKSIHVIAEVLNHCDCEVGMHFFRNHENELMFKSNYAVIQARKQ